MSSFFDTNNLYETLGIFLNISTNDDLINNIASILNSNYLSIISTNNSKLTKITSCPYTTDNYINKFAIYTSDFKGSCSISGTTSVSGFNYYANVIVLNPDFVNKNTSCNNLYTSIQNDSTVPQTFKDFLNFTGNDKCQLLLRFKDNTSSEELIFTDIMTVNINGINYYCIVNCHPFENTGGNYVYDIEYDIYQGITYTYDRKFVLQNVNVDGIDPKDKYNDSIQVINDIINVNNWCLTNDECFNLKNPYFKDQDQDQDYNTNTSFGIQDSLGGCYFPKYSDQSLYPYLDALIYNNNNSFDFSESTNLNPANNKLWFPVPDQQDGYKFVQIVNNDSIYVYNNNQSPKLSDLNGNPYYYESTTGGASIETDIIKRYIRYGWNGADTNDTYYIKLSDNTYQLFSDFMNGYNNASIFANGKYTNIKGYTSSLSQNYFYPLLNCTPDSSNPENCNFMLGGIPFATSTGDTTGNINLNPDTNIGLNQPNTLFDNNWGYVPDALQTVKTQANYLNVATKWYTSPDNQSFPKFYSDFYTRLSDPSYTVDTFCQSLNNTDATGSFTRSSNILSDPITSIETIKSFLTCSPPGNQCQVGPSPAPIIKKWWQNCDPNDSQNGCSYDHLGGGNPNFQMQLSENAPDGYYPIVDKNGGAQLTENTGLIDVYGNLGNRINGSCPFHKNNVLTKVTSLKQNDDGTYPNDEIYKCMFRGTPPGLYGSNAGSVDNNYPALDCSYGGNYDKGASAIMNSPFIFMAPLSFKPDTTDTASFSVSNSWNSTVGSGLSFKPDTNPFYYLSNDTAGPGESNGLGLNITIKNLESSSITITTNNMNGQKTPYTVKPGEVYSFVVTPVVNAPPEKICKIADSDSSFSSGGLSKDFTVNTGCDDNGNFASDSLPQSWCLNINDPFLDRSTSKSDPLFYFNVNVNNKNYKIVYDLGIKPTVVSNNGPNPFEDSCLFNETDPNKWGVYPSQPDDNTFMYGSSNACRKDTNQTNVIRFNFNISSSDTTIFGISDNYLQNNKIKLNQSKTCVTRDSSGNQTTIDNCETPNTQVTGVLPGCTNCNCNQRLNADGSAAKDSTGNNVYGLDADHQCAPVGGPYTFSYSIN